MPTDSTFWKPTPGLPDPFELFLVAFHNSARLPQTPNLGSWRHGLYPLLRPAFTLASPMDSSLSIQLQQAWLLSQISKLSPAPPSPLPPPISDLFPSSPFPWPLSSPSIDSPLDPSSPDLFWSDSSEVSDSWNSPVAPTVFSSSSDGTVLPKDWVVPAAQAVSVASDEKSFVPISDALVSGDRDSTANSWLPPPPPSVISKASSGVESLITKSGGTSVASVSSLSTFEDDVFMDHTMDYISEMLMDEQMEDRKCMEQECSAYQAIVNGFYDILGEDYSSLSSVIDVKPNPSELEARDEYSWIDDILVADPGSAQLTSASSVPPSPWEFDSSSSSNSQQHSNPLSYVSSSSGSHHSEDSSTYTSSLQDDGSWNSGNFLDENSARTQSYPSNTLANGSLNSFWPDSGVLTIPMVPYPTVGLPQFDTGTGKFRRVKSEDQNRHSEANPPVLNGHASDYGAYRRASSDKLHDKSRQSPQEAWKSVPDRNHSSERSRGTLNGVSIPRAYALENVDVKVGPVIDSERLIENDNSSLISEEKLSFVKNEDLNAEKHSKIYLEWSPSDKSFKEKMKAHSNGAYVKRADKPEAVDLRGLLVTCAQAVAANDLRKGNDLLQEIRQHASPYGSGGQRLAHYFAEALVARMSGTGARLYTAMSSNRPSAAKMLKAYHQFVEICPYAMISHYFANVHILKAAKGASRLHIVDYGILYGVQWPSLISALADREGGPPFLRITGIEFPQPGLKPAERLELTGKRLAEYAKHYNVPFEFHAIARQWEDVEPAHLRLNQGEVLAVNCIHRLHHLLDESVVASSPRRKVLSRMHSLNPDILLVAALNAGYNAPFFVSRFREALYHYSSKFDIMDTTVPSDNPERLMLEKEVMGRDIINIVACEGPERVERPETYRQWQARFQRAGFKQTQLSPSFVFKARALVKGFYHKDFGVDEDAKWILLGWKGRIVDALSAWKPASSGTGK